MAKDRQAKKEIVKKLTSVFKKIPSFYWVNFQGLKAEEEVILRRKLRENNVVYRVVKKTLLLRALKEANIKDIPYEAFSGQIALAYSEEDEIKALKLLSQYSSQYPALKLLGGFWQNEYLPLNKLKTLASLPSKEELLTFLLLRLKGPYFGLVKVLSGNIQKLILLINEISKTRSSKTS